MSQADMFALIVSYVCVFAVIFAGEVLGRVVFHGSSAVSRKIVHVGVGMWIVGTAILFDTWQAAIIPPLTFIPANYISYRLDLFKGIESKDKRNLGTVYFPIAFAIIIALCWARPAVMVAALMPMTWGDALAAIVGGHWGRTKLPGSARGKSWEGSLAMFAASFVSMALALAAFGVAGDAAFTAALLVAALAAIVEALTPYGLDNLTVPLLSAALLWLLV